MVQGIPVCPFPEEPASVQDQRPRRTFLQIDSAPVLKLITMEAKIIQLPKNGDRRGNLSVIEENCQIPFKIQRAFWIYDVPGGEFRGGHAYWEAEEFIVALSGSFDIIVDDGEEKKIFQLNRSYYGLYVPKRMWREMANFSTNSLALVLSSTPYNEADYIRDYEKFKRIKR